MTRPGSPPSERVTVGEALADLFRNPYRLLIERWHWKSALLSALVRGTLFFFSNLSAGRRAAFAALITEFVFRTCTVGFYGSITQVFRRAEPAWLAALTILVLLPALTHILEFLVHWLRGTQELRRSIIVSVVFTIVSTLFSWYVMRKGVFLVGAGKHDATLRDDLRQMPRLLGSFLLELPRAALRMIRPNRGA